MTLSDYEKADNRCKALGDFRLRRNYDGTYTMITLDDPDVGIYEQIISPDFSTTSAFEEWLDYMEEIFEK